MDHEIIGNIASCDPRYHGHTPDGNIVLIEGDEKQIMTPEEFMAEAEPGTDEIFFATINTFISQISSTSITSTSSVVDVLLDLRNLFVKHAEASKSVIKLLLRQAPDNDYADVES